MTKSTSIRKPLAGMLALMILVSVLTFTNVSANAAEEVSAGELSVQTLHAIGLHSGFGNDADSREFELSGVSTRLDGVVMLVRLMGAEGEALSGGYRSPFGDVPGWGSPYVGYAYDKGWTKGVSGTRFGPDSVMPATQFLTFILRALGYEDSADFKWNAAWELTDALGITDGEFSETRNTLIRGDMAVVSLTALSAPIKNSGHTLLERLIENGVFDELAQAGRTVDETILQALVSGGVEAIPDSEYLEMMSGFEESFGALLSSIFDVVLDFEWESDYADLEDDLNAWRQFYLEVKGEAELGINLLNDAADRVPLKYRQAHGYYINTVQWVLDVLTDFNEAAEAAAQSDEEVLIIAMGVFMNGMLQANESWLFARTGLASIVYQESIS